MLGLSVALNLSLVSFIVFLFKKQEFQIYEKFDTKVESVKNDSDPFRNL